MKKKSFWEKLVGKPGEDDEDSFQQLNAVEKDMIRGIVELSKTTVKEVMVPRVDVVIISKDIAVSELIDTIVSCGHSRLPVYDETIDNVIGVLYVKDLLKYFLDDTAVRENIKVADIVRKPYFIPESKRLDTLLREFKRRKVHIAVAVDEYGGISGVVCMEDIIEEIVGEIQDEFDNENEDVLELGSGVYLCDARVNLEDLNEITSLDLPEDEFDTLGGFVFDLLGRIPVKFEKVTYQDIDFIVQDMDGHKINSLKIIRKGGE